MAKRFALAALMILGAGLHAATPPALTAEQKQLVLDTLQSENLIVTVSRSVNPNMTPAHPTTDAIGQKFSTMLTALQNQIKSGACAASSVAIINGNSSGSCTWLFNQSLQSGNPPGGTTQYTSLNVTDPAVVAITDIVGIAGPNGGSMSFSVAADASVGTKVTGTGVLLSQTLGSVQVTTSGSGTYDTDLNPALNVEMDIQFPGFAAALVIQKSAAGEAYILNGQALTTMDLTYIKLAALQPTPKPGVP